MRCWSALADGGGFSAKIRRRRVNHLQPGRLARAVAAEGGGIVAEAPQGILEEGPTPDAHVGPPQAPLSIAEFAENAKRIDDAVPPGAGGAGVSGCAAALG